MIPAGPPRHGPPSSPAPSPQALGVGDAAAAVRWQPVALSLAERPGGCRKREMGRDEEKWKRGGGGGWRREENEGEKDVGREDKGGRRRGRERGKTREREDEGRRRMGRERTQKSPRRRTDRDRRQTGETQGDSRMGLWRREPPRCPLWCLPSGRSFGPLGLHSPARGRKPQVQPGCGKLFSPS